MEKTFETCSDNRFETIKNAKDDIIKSTNIETSPDEMRVLDNILFRCWQMGWLGKYNEKDEKPQLPKTWEEFCEMHPDYTGEYYIEPNDNVKVSQVSAMVGEKREYRNAELLPDRKTAEAVLALCQLIQLRDCYNQGWKPNWNDDDEKKYMIIFKGGEPFQMAPFYSVAYSPLYFKTEELRDMFLKNFRDLIEKIKPLYGIRKGGEE